MSVQTDVVIDDAKTAARYFQALLVEGVGPEAAVGLTNSYILCTITTRMNAAANAAKPAPEHERAS